MLNDVMNYYGLAREFQYAGFNVGYFETEHLNQIFKDICAAIHTGGFIMLTGPMGSGKTAALLRVRRALQEDKESKVLVSRSLATDKERITLGILMDALFFGLSGKKEIKIPTRSERRERELQVLFRQAKRPIALFVDDTHRLNANTLRGLKRLIEAVREDGTLAIVPAGQPKLKNELGKPILEEIGYRSATFPLYGIRDSKHEYISNGCSGLGSNDVVGPLPVDAFQQLGRMLPAHIHLVAHHLAGHEGGREVAPAACRAAV
jgi:type II secretory pathway predicted ATPase ExeA